MNKRKDNNSMKKILVLLFVSLLFTINTFSDTSPHNDGTEAENSIHEIPKFSTEHKTAEEFYEQGISNLKKENFQKAIDNFSYAISYGTSYGNSIYSKAAVFEAMGETNLAKNDYKCACHLYKLAKKALLKRAEIYKRLNQEEKKQADIQSASIINETVEEIIIEKKL